MYSSSKILEKMSSLIDSECTMLENAELDSGVNCSFEDDHCYRFYQVHRSD